MCQDAQNRDDVHQTSFYCLARRNKYKYQPYHRDNAWIKCWAATPTDIHLMYRVQKKEAKGMNDPHIYMTYTDPRSATKLKIGHVTIAQEDTHLWSAPTTKARVLRHHSTA
jgi:hypothetical protein